MRRNNLTSSPSFRLLRPAAILMMLAGAGGFITALIIYGEQVLCMLGSTVVTLVGMGLVMYQRRYAQSENSEPPYRQPGQTRQVWEPVMPEPAEPQAYPSQPASLTEYVTAILEQKGALVTLEAQRDQRSILKIQQGSGEMITAIVDETASLVDVSDARALLALTTNSSSDMGYYITEGEFAPRVFAWANGKPIRLIGREDINML